MGASWDTTMTELLVLEYQIAELTGHVNELQQHINRLESEERSRLKAGITVLGGLALGLLGIIWQFRQYILGGGQ